MFIKTTPKNHIRPYKLHVYILLGRSELTSIRNSEVAIFQGEFFIQL